MTSLSDVVDAVYPTSDATGVPLLASITVLFDREMDETSIENGGVFLEGADTDSLLVGVYPENIAPGDEPNLFETAAYSGLVPGVFTFKRIDLSTSVEVSTLDPTGNGTLYRTKAVFTPTFPLQKAFDYRIFITADPDAEDTEKFGVRTRSVFDAEADAGNTGTGTMSATGTYTGTVDDTYNIAFVVDGVAGAAQFEWWKNSTPLDIHGPILATYSSIPLADGVIIQFDDGNYEENDTFTVVVKPGVTFTDTLVSTFTTGNGSILAVPTSASTSVLGDVLPATTGFQVSKTTPADFATNLAPEVCKQIIIEFSAPVDEDTVTDDTVQVIAEAVTDHPAANIISPNGPIAKTITVDGNKIIIDL